MAEIINFGGTPVEEGERVVVHYLAQNLPDTFRLIPNIELVDRTNGERGQPFEYDLIVVAPHAVYVVEIKNWRGTIAGDDWDWLLNGLSRRKNPVRLVNYKTRVLKGALQRAGPAFHTVWVEGCVLIAAEDAALNLIGDTAERVFKYKDAPAFFRDATQVHQTPNALARLTDRIVEALRGGSYPRSRNPLTFGAYQVTETLAATSRAKEYLAKHSIEGEASSYRLRVFTIPPYLPSAEKERHRTTITREFLSLRAIGDHPNLLRVFDFFPMPDDAETFVEVTEWSNEGTLRKLITSPAVPLTVERKIEIMRGMANGLAAAHAKEILHRDVRPENVLINSAGTPRLMNFDRARITRDGAVTVWNREDETLDPRYFAPEIERGDSELSPAADLYSLGLVGYELLTGNLPYESLHAFTQLGGRLDSLPAAILENVPNWLHPVLGRLIDVDVHARYQTAQELIAALAPLPDEIAPAPRRITKRKYESGDLVGDFRILRPIDEGGFAQVYLALNTVIDRQYALKCINASVDTNRLKIEYQTMESLDHPHIARVKWAGFIPAEGNTPGQYYLATEFIDGENLKEYAAHKKILALTEIREVTRQLLEALEYMHPKPKRAQELRARLDDLTAEELNEYLAAQQGIYHRDLKPANIIYNRDGVKLIDFNIAVWATETSREQIGTPEYAAPEWWQMREFDASCELFSLGVVLYELVTGKHPYADDQPSFDKTPRDPREWKPELAPPFADFLLKAVAPHREDRFQTAHEMLSAFDSIKELTAVYPILLLPLQKGLTPAEIRNLIPDREFVPNSNPYLTRFLALYSQARKSNALTRGLDPISLATYVSTQLDTALLPAILGGAHSLVIITGNAGDGKTAFIQQLETEAKGRGAVLTPTNGSQNGNHFTLGGFSFVTNYDGSQDEQGRVNDDVLSEFFAPFASYNALAQGERRVHVIAINEGRLRDFIAAHQSEYQNLTEIVSNYFEPEMPTPPPPGILIVNLNWRSVVAGGSESILVRQLHALLNETFWMPCNTCAFRERCPTFFNINTFRDPVAGPQAQERLRTLFEVVAMRRQQHITMRDLRSALSYILFRDRDCGEIIQSLDAPQDPLDALNYYYYNGIASNAQSETEEDLTDRETISSETPGSADRLIRLLQQIDIALVNNPTDDRELHFDGPNGLLLAEWDNRSDEESALIERVRADLPTGWTLMQQPDWFERHKRFHAMMRRKAFFERRDNWRRMLPFHELVRFQQATQTDDASAHQIAQDALRRSLMVGLSALEGCRNSALTEKYVCLRAGGADKPTIQSFRLFDANDFSLFVPLSPDKYLEYIPDSVILRHRSIDNAFDAELRVTVDLLELLAQVEAGFAPSLNDLRGAYVNLVIFRNALARLRYQALLLDDESVTYRMEIDDQNVIALEKV